MSWYVTAVFKDRLTHSFEAAVVLGNTTQEAFQAATKRIKPKRPNEIVPLGIIKLPIERGNYFISYHFTVRSNEQKPLQGFGYEVISLPTLESSTDIDSLSQHIITRFLKPQYPHASHLEVTIINIQAT